ncbi:hypothetical protein THRCLA_20715 [Thraustotheca clavata]|uniref:Uncharacterized protein n=1 Tax=Thraustotheca clavata TaxID=74557 RepID=A0A1W0A4D0_9STRA|nr:hypothetical protein THRCLA_20715 [Thraustotheca clavata]
MKQVLREFRKKKTISIAMPPSNKSNHPTRVPNTKSRHSAQVIQRPMRDKNSDSSKGCVHVLALLCELNIISLKMSNKNDVNKKDMQLVLEQFKHF